MIEINEICCRDLILIDTIEVPDESTEGTITVEGGYYPICLIVDEGDLWEIAIRIDDESVVYIPSENEELIKDYIKKW